MTGTFPVLDPALPLGRPGPFLDDRPRAAREVGYALIGWLRSHPAVAARWWS